jgi:predicted HD phosphohydrolase
MAPAVAWWGVRRGPFSSVDDILDALGGLEGRRGGDDVVGVLAHLLQTAELLAATHPDDPELVAAGLTHDVGSAFGARAAGHARAGARMVEPVLGPRVAGLVAGHADAKRYLVTVEPFYASCLSAGSTTTLVGQGGTMTAEEVEEFASRPLAASLVTLRRADDAAKIPGGRVRPVGDWRSVLDAVARQARNTASSSSGTITSSWA